MVDRVSLSGYRLGAPPRPMVAVPLAFLRLPESSKPRRLGPLCVKGRDSDFGP